MIKQYETAIVKKILRFLNSLPGVFAYKRNEGLYRRGLPDITGSVLGFRLELECKRPGNTATEIQKHYIEKWRSIGAISGIVHNVKEVAEIIIDFFERRNPGETPVPWPRLRTAIETLAGRELGAAPDPHPQPGRTSTLRLRRGNRKENPHPARSRRACPKHAAGGTVPGN